MKTTFLSIAFCLFVVLGQSQLTPEACLGKIPALPNNICGCGAAEKEAFQKLIKTISADIGADIDKYSEPLKKFTEQNKDKDQALITATAMQANMANMRPDEIQKMIAEIQEQQRLSEEYKNKLAELDQTQADVRAAYEKERKQRIDPLDKEIEKLRSNATEANYSAAARLEDEETKILNELCTKYTPNMLAYFDGLLTALKTTGLPLFKIQDDQIKKSINLKINLYVTQNGAIAQYIEDLKDIFVFNVKEERSWD